MLCIHLDEKELFNENTQEFIYIKEQDLYLEHSLVSISRWESKWHKSFLSIKEKTKEEVLDYIRCMTINKNIDPSIFYCLSSIDLKKIEDYIEDPYTATTFMDHEETAPSRNIITSELIYFWMASYGIPFECEKWHINRLLALIKICSIKNSPEKKMSKSATARQNRALNQARRQRLKTRG